MYEISPVYARIVLRELRRRGVPDGPLFEGTTLNSRHLETAGNISADNFTRFLVNARRITGDAQLGLFIGQNCNVITLGPVGAAIATAPSLRAGLQALESFNRLHSTYADVRLVSNLEGVAVYLAFRGIAEEVERFHVESGFLLLQHLVEMINGEPLKGVCFRLAYRKPGYSAAYAGAFHGRVEFSCPQHCATLPRENLDLPSPYYNAEIWYQAQLILAKRLKELTGLQGMSYTQHVNALLRSVEPPLPELSNVAQKLHLSERTLNRRLQAEDTRFRDLRAAELNAWALRYLEHTDHSVEAIAASLGYQDAANFRRAFRARNQCSPGHYRRRVKSAGAIH
jgi:AraC-like DNA-binding protein